MLQETDADRAMIRVGHGDRSPSAARTRRRSTARLTTRPAESEGESEHDSGDEPSDHDGSPAVESEREEPMALRRAGRGTPTRAAPPRPLKTPSVHTDSTASNPGYDIL